MATKTKKRRSSNYKRKRSVKKRVKSHRISKSHKSPKGCKHKPKSKISDAVVSKTKLKNGVVEIIVKKVLTDNQVAKCEADYFDEKDYAVIVDFDCDCYYYNENKEKILLLKFRKKVLPDHLCQEGIKYLKKAAMKKHDNRGASAGKLDLKKLPKYANDPNLFYRRSKYRMLGYYSKLTGKFVNNSLGNQSMSNIIGYFDKRDRNLGAGAPPCRTTAYTSQQVEKWVKVIPLIKAIDRQFKKLVPDRHEIQRKQAQETDFVIADTAFSTVTINYNWRTALHKDAGDLKQGYGNLVVLEEGKYKGGSTGFPQFGVAVDVRHGDFLAMDVHEWHCNTKLHGITKDYTRLSLVAYLRENMLRCKGMKIV
jgi:hypothetical protein